MVLTLPLSAHLVRANAQSDHENKENEAKAGRLAEDKKAEEVEKTAREKAIVDREEKNKQEKERRKRERNQIEYDIKVSEEKAWVVKENLFLEKQRADRAEIARSEKAVADEVERKSQERDNQMCTCTLTYFSPHRYCPSSLRLTLSPSFLSWSFLLSNIVFSCPFPSLRSYSLAVIFSSLYSTFSIAIPFMWT